MSLTYELLKNCTTIVELFDVNDLFSELAGEKCKVYGLRADFGYPAHLIPKSTYKYIAYIGISNRKLETSYGQAHFIEFYYEPKDIGILEHFFDMYIESEEEILKECGYKQDEEFTVEIFPSKITKKNRSFWKSYLDDQHCVNDRISLRDFLDDYKVTHQIDCERLYDHLPENIDDLDNESEYNSESESELEEGEIRT
jgi:hypothetical protein